MDKTGEEYEIIVVDDASTDRTRAIAEQLEARVPSVTLRKVSAVRNAGAREAGGSIFFFVDADTQVNEQAVAAALAAMRAGGAAGGGCVFDFDQPVPIWARAALFAGCVVGRLIRWVGGCFLFCSREAFEASGGFDETLSVGEDIAFCQAIKKVGRFVVPKPKVVTSARKLGVVTPWEVLGLMATIVVRGARYESKWATDLIYGRKACEARNALALPSPGVPGEGKSVRR